MPFISDTGRIVEVLHNNDQPCTIITIEAPIPCEDVFPDGQRRYLLEIMGNPSTGFFEILEDVVGLDVAFFGLLQFPESSVLGSSLELRVAVQAVALTPESWLKATNMRNSEGT